MVVEVCDDVDRGAVDGPLVDDAVDPPPVDDAVDPPQAATARQIVSRPAIDRETCRRCMRKLIR